MFKKKNIACLNRESRKKMTSEVDNSNNIMTSEKIKKMQEIIGVEATERYLKQEAKLQKDKINKAIDKLAESYIQDESSEFYAEYKMCDDICIGIWKLAKAKAKKVLEKNLVKMTETKAETKTETKVETKSTNK